jgi:hypothetical protein
MTLERTAPPVDEAELRASISRARAQVQGTAHALRQEVKQAWDIRRWVQRHPVIVLGAAFLVGTWAGSRRRRPPPHEPLRRFRRP